MPLGLCLLRLFRDDGFYGANISARTAVGADIGVDYVDIAFGNGINGAFIDAGATSCAVIGNFVSHSGIVLVYYERLPLQRYRTVNT